MSEEQYQSLLDADEMFANLGITALVKGSQPPEEGPPEEEVIMTPDAPPSSENRPSSPTQSTPPALRPGRSGVYSLPDIDDDLAPPPSALEPPPESPTPSVSPALPHAPSSPEVLDSRVPEVEQLLSNGNWSGVCDLLGSPEEVKNLPPVLQLVYGVARREAMSDKVTTSDTDVLAISAMAQLAGVSEDSPLALMITKRALRGKRPWATQKASKSFTVIFLILGLALGLGAGWAYTYFF